MTRPFSETCKPSDFRNPDLFLSGFAKDSGEYADAQYAKGLEIGRQARKVTISIYGVWGAESKDGGQTSSYERLGYHAGTSSLLRGFLDSGAPIYAHRRERGASDFVQRCSRGCAKGDGCVDCE